MGIEALAKNLGGFNTAKLPREFSKDMGWKRTVSREDEGSGYFSGWSSGRQNTLNNYTLRCLLALNGKDGGKLSIVKIADNQYAAERMRSSGDTCLATCDETGKLRAAVVDPQGAWSAYPKLDAMETDLTVIYAVYLMLLARNPNILTPSDTAMTSQCSEAFRKICTEPDLDRVKEQVFFLNSALYEGFIRKKLKSDIPAANCAALLTETDCRALAGGTVVCGAPAFFAAKPGSSPFAGVITLGEVRSEFEQWAKSRKWTKEEEAFIPEFPDDYPVMPEALTIARRFVASRGFRRPINNVLWRGITAYGKSTGVEMIACMLHTPLLRVTCSSNMEAQDFLSNFIPESGNSGAPDSRSGYPSFTEMESDPEGAYEKMTGLFRPGIGADEVLSEYVKRKSSEGRNGSVRYRLVESNFVRALRRGMICEVQEISRIRDAGVLVTLNEYDRAGSVIPLADGRTAVRDRNAMVIYTDNIGYRSCHPVDPSVMRRMDFVKDSYELTDEQVEARVIYNTGFSDGGKLRKMMKVWKSVISYCRMNDITEGEISVNELERWVNILMIEGDTAYEDGCFECIVAKATPVREDQELIKQNIINELRAPA